MKPDRKRVDSVPLIRGRMPFVVEDVAEMAVAAAAQDLHSTCGMVGICTQKCLLGRRKCAPMSEATDTLHLPAL
jgi:hypothetical protein